MTQTARYGTRPSMRMRTFTMQTVCMANALTALYMALRFLFRGARALDMGILGRCGAQSQASCHRSSRLHGRRNRHRLPVEPLFVALDERRPNRTLHVGERSVDGAAARKVEQRRRNKA
mmetsp:Transcript_17265/g.38760  ORF Transcript_17265/g.38760 Transcript_17265/m.38760 type:complete len:119 (-) Transcript_17265:617-973(-)